jgi:hypothetical protein
MTDSPAENGETGEPETEAAADVEVGDHLRVATPQAPAAGTLQAGVFRVVGGDAGAVTLLRVAGHEGQRLHTGDVTRVPRDSVSGLTVGPDPDASPPLGRRISGLFEGLRWQVSVVASTVKTNPATGVAGLALLALGFVGEDLLALPRGSEILFLLGGLATLFALSRGGE